LNVKEEGESFASSSNDFFRPIDYEIIFLKIYLMMLDIAIKMPSGAMREN